ncbi:MAG: primosomal protein N' [Microbacteriaceae bacterium]
MPPAIARVLLDSPLPQLDRLFDYRVPAALAPQAVPGVRVTVPLRSAGRTSQGWIVELAEEAGFPGALSELESVVSPVPVLQPEVWRLARAAANRAAGTASDILRIAIPPRAVRVEKAWLAAGPVEPPEPPAARGRPAAAAVAVRGYPMLADAVAAHARVALDAIPEPVRLDAGEATAGAERWVGGWAGTLAELAALTLGRGESAIVAVPDYRDQAQLVAALSGLVAPDDVVALDARQRGPQRYAAFLRLLQGVPRIVVGTRSAVYAPAPALGLIAIWDDGDPLHAEPLAPYVHSRDAALLRQEQSGAALVIAGHSRSTDVERLVGIGWLTAMGPEPAVLPRVILTANATRDDTPASRARIPTLAWREARQALEHGPVLVQVGRPGYAPRLACADCGRSARCRRCEGPLAVRRRGQTPACDWCGALAADWRCAGCSGTRFRLSRAGSARTAEELGRAFPGVRVVLADGEHPVLTVGAEPALVVATRGAEPLAAGGYRAVLLLDGDTMVARESLRVAEDCLRWWSNAAALAARRAPVLLAGVGGSIAAALATWRQPEFARAELADRTALRFPPAVRVASVTGPEELVAEVVARLDLPAEDLLGPVPVAAAGTAAGGPGVAGPGVAGPGAAEHVAGPGTGAVRTIVRFDYARGAAVAEALKAETVRLATARRRPGGQRPGRPRPAVRLRLDDQEPFLDR